MIEVTYYRISYVVMPIILWFQYCLHNNDKIGCQFHKSRYQLAQIINKKNEATLNVKSFFFSFQTFQILR